MALVLEASQLLDWQNHELNMRHYEALLVQVTVEKAEVNALGQTLNVLAQEQEAAQDFPPSYNGKG